MLSHLNIKSTVPFQSSQSTPHPPATSLLYPTRSSLAISHLQLLSVPDCLLSPHTRSSPWTDERLDSHILLYQSVLQQKFQFFHDFSFQGFLGCFSFFYLSTRKFPAVFEFSVSPLSCKNNIFTIFIYCFDNCRYYFYCFHTIYFLLL